MISFDPDKAILKRENDLLRRSGYSEKLGEAILNYEGTDSLVIGLLGNWGDGKTSIINMALEYVEDTVKGEEGPIIIKFNPWLFSSQNQLIKKFFDELIVELKDESTIEKLKSYVNRLIPPIMGLAAILDPARTQALFKTSEYVDSLQTEEESLENIKNELDDSILKINRKIIVVIDDIDRLSTFEIRQTFQLVKLIADFPNTVYLLSFDKKVVFKALKEVQQIDGSEYLKKVVQIPFEVPKIYKGYIEDFLFSQINQLFDSNDKFDQTYWWNLYHSGLKYFFDNLRDVKLYINALNFNFQIIKDEVNSSDFLAITAIQIFENEVYQDIRNNKELFAGTFNATGQAYNQKKDLNQKRCDEIISKAKAPIREPLKELLKYMFPKINSFYGNTNYGNDWLSVWRKDVRICSPDIFDAYFGLSIPQDEISQQDIKSVISLSNNNKTLTDALLNLGDKIVRFLERFEDFTLEFPEENIEKVITVLMDIGDEFPNKQNEFFGYNTSMRILRILHQLLFRFNTYDERFNILKRAIENSENSLYVSVHEIAVEDQVHGRYGLAKLPSPQSEWKVSSDQLDELEQLVCSRINKWAQDGRLYEHENLIEILFDWKRWESSNATNYVNELIKTDEGLISFINHFFIKSSMYTITDKVTKPFWTMSLENIESLVKLDKIQPRIQKIVNSKDFHNFDDNTQKALTLFLEKYEEQN